MRVIAKEENVGQISLSKHPTIRGAEVLAGWFDVKASIDEVFPFFADVRNLEEITPKRLKFSVMDAPDRALKGSDVVLFRLKVHGIPIKWRSKIVEWDAPNLFTDLQEQGPYSLWRHSHRFEALPGGGTRCFDRVEFKSPFAWFTHLLFVRRDVLGIFSYREQVVSARFGVKQAQV